MGAESAGGEQDDRDQAGSQLAGETLGTFPPVPQNEIRQMTDANPRR